jgi:hypothetical protein
MTDPGNAASRSVAVKVGMRSLWENYVDEHGPAHVYAIRRPPGAGTETQGSRFEPRRED